MRICVLNPPFLRKYSRESRSPAVAKSGTLYYPMWLAYAAGYLEKNNHEVTLIDAPADGISREETVKRVAEFNPGLVVLGSSTPSIYNDMDVSGEVKSALPGVYTVLVGVHVSAVPEQTLKEAGERVDAVAVHEYEETLAELASVISNSGGLDDTAKKGIKGLAFKKENGEIAVNPDREPINDLDKFPFVSSIYKRFLDTRNYFYGHSRYPLIVIVTGRGCPFRCNYCVYPQTLHGHRYRTRSIESVVKEFVYISENFPDVKEIMIEDDTLTADTERCRAFSRSLKESGVKIPWSANSRAEIDYDTLKMMKEAGCRLLCVGFESGNQKVLDNMRKKITLERMHRFAKDAKKAGVLIHGCFLVGNKGETEETLNQTLEFAKKLNPDTAQFYPIMVYPGTEAYEYFKKKGWIVTENYREWLTPEGLHSSVVSNPDLTYEMLVDFCDKARMKFYLRPRYLVGKFFQIFRHPGEARRIFKASGTFFKYLLRPSIKQ